MKFVMIKEFDWDLSKDKVIIGETNEEYISTYSDSDRKGKHILNYKITISYLLKMGDFDENKEYIILRNTASVQIRPKAIYKNDKGYYKKVDNKRVFFNNEEVLEIENAIEKFKKYLSEVKK